VNRGEIWSVAGGVYASKPRPALIIQDDAFDVDSITVLPLTSTLIDAPEYRFRIAATQSSGLNVPSDVMIDRITTIPRRNATAKIGELSKSQLLNVERLLLTFLGMAR
jgi:mRNA interferase MazF